MGVFQVVWKINVSLKVSIDVMVQQLDKYLVMLIRFWFSYFFVCIIYDYLYEKKLIIRDQ